MNGFLYVEPYEVRKEIILRPKDLMHWLPLDLEGRETIPVAMQAELKRTVAEFLRERHPVRIDGRAVPPDPAMAPSSQLCSVALNAAANSATAAASPPDVHQWVTSSSADCAVPAATRAVAANRRAMDFMVSSLGSTSDSVVPKSL